MRKRCRQISSLVSPVGASTSSLSLRSLHLMFTLYQRCLACICRRSRCRASTLTGTREACRVVSVGQNWHLDCDRSLHSAAELVPGRSIDTVSFCGWAPCHAEAALYKYTSCNIPSSRMGNFFVMSSSSMASQSTLALCLVPCQLGSLLVHFSICACHPCAGAMLIFSVSFQFYRMIPKGIHKCVSAWWNRGILDEVTKASYGRAVTGTAVMARSANEKKKKKKTCQLGSLGR